MTKVDQPADVEPELLAWLHARFPDPSAGADRVGSGDLRWRRRRRLRLLLVLAAVLLPLGVFGVVFALRTGAHAAHEPPAPSPVDGNLTLQVLLVCLWVIALGLEGYGLVRQRRALRPLRLTPAARVLRGLTRGQRRELLREVRGQAPVSPGDEPILDHLARTMIATSWAAVVSVGVPLLGVAALVDSPPGPLFQPVRVMLVVAIALAATGALLILRDRRRAIAYLRRRT